jgi:hypothetical protein
MTWSLSWMDTWSACTQPRAQPGKALLNTPQEPARGTPEQTVDESAQPCLEAAHDALLRIAGAEWPDGAADMTALTTPSVLERV